MLSIKRFCQFFGLLVFIGGSLTSFGQTTVTNNLTVEQYVQNVLLGGGVTVSNIQFNGGAATIVSESVGEFNAPVGNFGLTNGLILGSGDVQLAAQANLGGGSSLGGSGTQGVDTDLQSITPNQIFDEAVIEFDFVPAGNLISFRYVFASEEYPEYVCGSVNDAFGFFLTGTNPAGGTYNAANIALIPDPANPGSFTTTAVSINSVNPGVSGFAGDPSNCDAIYPNWATYSIFYAGDNVTTNYEYDGNTVVLVAQASVVCGQTYHIKLAIGDAGDNVFDSGVFLEGGSFASEAVDKYIISKDKTRSNKL
ncbi:MAG: choice-of-anchor L domain-containing protein [Flavobacteriia bacterium]|nr:choice-of-anchor L domain-containing protein [Flavobacteriia bacterium]